MSIHTMELDNGHIILAEDDGTRYVLDTGSPFSFADEEQTLDIAGETHTLSPNGMAKVESLNVLMAEPVDGLLGLDVLNRKCLELDFKNQCIRVNEPVSGKYTESIPLTVSGMTGLIFKAKVNGSECRGILDTGAFVSYAAPELLAYTPACGEIDDYNPIIGRIHTTAHDVQLVLGSKTFTHRAGKMCGMLEQMMGMAAMLGLADMKFVMGISSLGLDAVCIDLQKNLLRI